MWLTTPGDTLKKTIVRVFAGGCYLCTFELGILSLVCSGGIRERKTKVFDQVGLISITSKPVSNPGPSILYTALYFPLLNLQARNEHSGDRGE